MLDVFSTFSQRVRLRPRALQAATAPQLGLRSILLLSAASSLGWAMWHAEWRASDTAFELALVTLLLSFAALLVRRARALEPWLNLLLLPALALVFAFFVRLLISFAPTDSRFAPVLIAAAVLVGLGLSRDPAVERWRLPVFLGVYAWLGLWRIQTSPSPHIDVWVWHNEALNALLHGQNPYAISMPNIYENAAFYDPSMVAGGRVHTGFQYPPLSLLFALPGYLLGDYRYSLLAGMIVAGACMAYARPRGYGAIAMALWLLCPRSLFILEHGYTEPMLVLLLSVFLFCVVRRSKYAYVPLGLLLAGKQYMAIFIPLVWLLPLEAGRPGAHWRLLWRALAVGALVTLPFFVINPRAFFDCMVLLQLRQPFRIESLSLVAWWVIHHGQRLPDWLGFASVLPTSALALWRCERSAAGMAAGVGFVSLVFFGLSKQAFGNYYFFTLGALCCAVAFVHDAGVRKLAG